MNILTIVWLNNIHFYSLLIAQMKHFTKVAQLYNKNQFVIKNEIETIFQSYDSVIAIINRYEKTLTLWIDYDYSKTTSKHLKLFLSDYLWFNYETKKQLENIIKDWILEIWYTTYKVIYDENLR